MLVKADTVAAAHLGVAAAVGPHELSPAIRVVLRMHVHDVAVDPLQHVERAQLVPEALRKLLHPVLAFQGRLLQRALDTQHAQAAEVCGRQHSLRVGMNLASASPV